MAVVIICDIFVFLNKPVLSTGFFIDKVVGL